jgi:hypothetical protein
LSVRIFQNEAAEQADRTPRLEQNDEWAVQRPRYTTLKAIAALGDGRAAKLPCMAS